MPAAYPPAAMAALMSSATLRYSDGDLGTSCSAAMKSERSVLAAPRGGCGSVNRLTAGIIRLPAG